MTFVCSNPPGFWQIGTLVTPGALALVTLAFVALLAASLIAVGVDAYTWRQPAAARAVGGSGGRLALLWLIVLFAITWSAKLLLMREVPVTTPFWDQWDGEAAVLLVPFQHCALPWRTMFVLHNEHRIFFTRLLALDLLAVNGQWDPRLEQVVNAAMYALTAVLMATVCWLAGGRRRLELLVLACTLSFALPGAWENSLSGFQSGFYFLLLFSLLALWLTTAHPALSLRWWLGWLCAVCGIFTAAGGGLLIAAAIAVVALLKLLEDPRDWREPAITIAAAAAVFALAGALAAPPLPQHAMLKAASAAEFWSAVGHALAWPWLPLPLVSLVMWLPVAALVVTALLRRGRTTEGERLVVGLGVWVLLQSASVAYGRGAGGGAPTSRYLDFPSMGFIANVAALLMVLDRWRGGRLANRVALGVCAVWIGFGIVGADQLTLAAFGDLATWRQYFVAHAVNVRTYLITNDRQALVSKRPLIDLPYPNPEDLAKYLDYPDIRRILPSAIREPLPATPLASADAAFVPDGTPMHDEHEPLVRTWGSYAAQGRATQGRFESAPIPSCRAIGRLQFQVSGYLGTPGHSLAVKDLASGREVAVRPWSVPREKWLTVSVACPARPFAIVAVDATPDSWFAFRDPVEVGWASLWAEWLIATSRGVLLVSLALAVAAIRADKR